jgi:hypothetical protein
MTCPSRSECEQHQLEISSAPSLEVLTQNHAGVVTALSEKTDESTDTII